MKNKNNNDILDNILLASDRADLQVSEDVYDESGQKLLAKGYKITTSIREKILNKVLKKPIETCIAAENSITNEDLASAAQLIIENSPLLNVLPLNKSDEVAAFKKVKIAPLASMLLTVMKDGESNKLNHSVLVTLIARSIADHMNLSQQELTHLTIASLLHDVGELYASVPESGELTIDEWRKVMSHPVLGGSVVKLYMDYPAPVSTAIYEHHARCDGSGYPPELDADNCSLLGQVLILAEAIAGMLKPGVNAQSVIVAFKLSSGIYPSKPLIALNSMLKSLPKTDSDADKNITIDLLSMKIDTLNTVQLKLEGLLKEQGIPELILPTATHVKTRIDKLKRSVFDSGIHYYLDDHTWVDTGDHQLVMLELEAATNEIGWQIQDILRDITLRLVGFRGKLPKLFTEVTEQLAQVDLSKKEA